MSPNSRSTRRAFLRLAGAALSGAALSGAALSACAPARAPTSLLPQATFYVSPRGNDAWSGRSPVPNADQSDGPFATLDRARQAVHALKVSASLTEPVTVYIRGGRYELAEPLQFDAGDSAPVTYAAYPGETPTFDGGRRIGGWRIERHPFIDGAEVWTTELPEVAAGQWHFKQLWVNGQRRPRARLPKVGPEPERRRFYQIAGPSSGQDYFSGTNTFKVSPGVIDPAWRNMQDVEIVLLHFWIEERMPIESYDPETRTVTSSRTSVMTIKQLNYFYVENVFEALTEPGEWYLDRSAGKLYYLPLPGETPGAVEAYAPRLEQLMLLRGNPSAGEFVEFLRFEGLTFEHAEWSRPPVSSAPGWTKAANTAPAAYWAQAAAAAPAVISLKGARYCAIENCVVRHTGFYGIELGDGCLSNRIVGNELFDLGAGGVKQNGAPSFHDVNLVTGKNRITDNHIHQAGRVFHAGVGVLSQNAFDCDISHNHIHDLFYSGISCGWVWGYGENISRNNRIERNHIHDLGFGWLSDMGGIYMLGVQPGTVIRGNLIHDVERASYGGWGIYLDEGSSEMLVENNVCHDLSSQPFHTHYGRANLVRNNIFAFGRDSQVVLSRGESHVSFTLERNIIVTGSAPIFAGGYANTSIQLYIESDRNLFWGVGGRPWRFTLIDDTLESWQRTGHDAHSIVADPLFRDVAARDFTLAPDSPAFALGFQPINLSGIGPRPKPARS